MLTTEQAASHFAYVWSQVPPQEFATALNCTELDALAVLLRTHGYADEADAWIEAHAEGDDEGDAHSPTGGEGSEWPPTGWQFLALENDHVRVIDPEGNTWRVHVEDADSEHRFEAIRHAATWFANRPSE